MNEETNQPKICSICGSNYIGFGNNAWPVNSGRCCDACNAIVLNHRMTNVARGKGAYGYPEWFNHDLWKELHEYLAKQAEAEYKAK